MKQIKAVLLGYGNRGQIYGDHSLSNPEELKIIAVIETNSVRLQEAKEKYNLPTEMTFKSLDVFLEKKIECDIVFNAVMDEMHYITAIKLLTAKYNLLLEKPITANYKELLKIQQLANENNCMVFVGHVLRYSPFYLAIKKLISDGKIGNICTIEMNEHIYLPHFIDSYIRGKWNSEKKCGSPLLLAKCCHDTDLLCWFNSPNQPINVASIGSRGVFAVEKAPKGATEFCYQCPFKDTCLYSAIKIHLEFDCFPFQTWEKIHKPLDQITKEDKLEFLKHDDYGRCVYKVSGDLVDRQSMIVEFQNNITCTFNVVGGTPKGERYIDIVGSKGEIRGYFEAGKIKLLQTIIDERKHYTYTEQEINVNDQIVSNEYGGHGGGDFALVRDIIKYLNGERNLISITNINDSINGHLIVYAAEKSRKSGKTININETFKSKD